MTTGRTEEFYEGDQDTVLSTAGIGETMQEVLARRWSRRGLVKGGLAAGLVLTAAGRDMRIAGAQGATPVTGEAAQPGGLSFTPSRSIPVTTSSSRPVTPPSPSCAGATRSWRERQTGT